MILGAIGDDFTGSSDLALMLAKGGMRTVQYVGVPDAPAESGVQAGIVALKSRSVPADEAVAQSRAALVWLRAQGCAQFYFKYCSTFDSTPAGNIGPVIDALIDALGAQTPVLVCPAFPAAGRTVFQGHLFVGDQLLSESGMERHPLTPMTDPDLRRWLGLQTARPIGHLPLAALRGDARAALLAEAAGGRQVIVADAVENDDLLLLAAAAKGFELLTGGSGLALGLPKLHAATGAGQPWRGEAGPALAVSGSCSLATRAQVARHAADGGPVLKLDVARVVAGEIGPAEALDWAVAQTGLPLVYSSDDPEAVARAQAAMGRERSAAALDAFFGELAARAAARGFARLISAGGETSGAVVQALGARVMEIGPEIAPGVPALRVAGRPLVLALKSGNFGQDDFFARAAIVLAAR